MSNYKEVTGDLIELTLAGNFQVIAHGCNCFCTMKRGLAPQMVKAFEVDQYEMEQEPWRGNINKLGQIEWKYSYTKLPPAKDDWRFKVVNCYTQYHWSTPENPKPLDYEALTLCLRKMNMIFKGQTIGLPQIGCNLAGGDWDIVKSIIQKELKDCQVTIVIYDKN